MVEGGMEGTYESSTSFMALSHALPRSLLDSGRVLNEPEDVGVKLHSRELNLD
jgi:hypothetical protein